jgi:predicted Zn-dependent peptidase
VRLTLLPTDRFTTTWCRVAFHRRLGPEATATALLGRVLESATAAHPTRQALAWRLADLYGASLSVDVQRLGERQVLAASLEWPTAHVPAARGLLASGLALLREVLAEPLRAGHAPSGPLEATLVATERANHRRELQALADDKGRKALRRALEVACAGEPYALEVLGRVEDLDAATPEALARLHHRLIRTAPVDVFLVGDLDLAEARAAVREHLLWPRDASPARPPPLSAARAARPRAVRVVERDDVAQGRLVLVWRGRIAPGSRLAPAARTLAGVLGGGPYGRLFKVVRETHGLAYGAHAAWHGWKGLLVAEAGVAPADEARARRLVLQLEREVASGILDAAALEGHRQAVQHHFAGLPENRAALVAWHQECLVLGRDPSPEAPLQALRAVTPADVRRVGRRLRLDTTYVLTSRRAR